MFRLPFSAVHAVSHFSVLLCSRDSDLSTIISNLHHTRQHGMPEGQPCSDISLTSTHSGSKDTQVHIFYAKLRDSSSFKKNSLFLSHSLFHFLSSLTCCGYVVTEPVRWGEREREKEGEKNKGRLESCVVSGESRQQRSRARQAEKGGWGLGGWLAAATERAVN
ncbi:sterile alpha motif domain-containing protein 11 isoform X2 [Tachysurus ichikawai]